MRRGTQITIRFISQPQGFPKTIDRLKYRVLTLCQSLIVMGQIICVRGCYFVNLCVKDFIYLETSMYLYKIFYLEKILKMSLNNLNIF